MAMAIPSSFQTPSGLAALTRSVYVPAPISDRETLCSGIERDPVAVARLEPVGERVHLRGREGQRREFERDQGGLVGEGQGPEGGERIRGA